MRKMKLLFYSSSDHSENSTDEIAEDLKSASWEDNTTCHQLRGKDWRQSKEKSEQESSKQNNPPKTLLGSSTITDVFVKLQFI